VGFLLPWYAQGLLLICVLGIFPICVSVMFSLDKVYFDHFFPFYDHPLFFYRKILTDQTLVTFGLLSFLFIFTICIFLLFGMSILSEARYALSLLKTFGDPYLQQFNGTEADLVANRAWLLGPVLAFIRDTFSSIVNDAGVVHTEPLWAALNINGSHWAPLLDPMVNHLIQLYNSPTHDSTGLVSYSLANVNTASFWGTLFDSVRLDASMMEFSQELAKMLKDYTTAAWQQLWIITVATVNLISEWLVFSMSLFYLLRAEADPVRKILAELLPSVPGSTVARLHKIVEDVFFLPFKNALVTSALTLLVFPLAGCELRYLPAFLVFLLAAVPVVAWYYVWLLWAGVAIFLQGERVQGLVLAVCAFGFDYYRSSVPWLTLSSERDDALGMLSLPLCL